MPWCDTCSRFYNPNTLRPDGSCPNCGRIVAPGGAAAAAEQERVPWHFWVLLTAVVVYLGWRLVQGIGWLVGGL